MSPRPSLKNRRAGVLFARLSERGAKEKPNIRCFGEYLTFLKERLQNERDRDRGENTAGGANPFELQINFYN